MIALSSLLPSSVPNKSEPVNGDFESLFLEIFTEILTFFDSNVLLKKAQVGVGTLLFGVTPDISASVLALDGGVFCHLSYGVGLFVGFEGIDQEIEDYGLNFHIGTIIPALLSAMGGDNMIIWDGVNSIVLLLFCIIFVKFQKDGYAKIWVMPHYGDADSVQRFEVQPHWTFHLLNYYEDDNEQENRL
ncbi:hypothetical protein EZV62_015090 [Acer yangbiense]|uniref:Uncharacterized protein n=1 Tax=Acer yangbiense TaxID=1000413 RepID=A0A5C7HTS1_9ROSI|nr:hypothetical protein EZV62_015090 [Acer yangbiense]